MTDERLADLFAEGTAPERDAAFARRVEAEIGRARLARRYLAPAARALAILALAGVVFTTARVMDPVLAPVAESAPQFMGVPLPLILGVLAIGLIVRARRFVVLRR